MFCHQLNKRGSASQASKAGSKCIVNSHPSFTGHGSIDGARILIWPFSCALEVDVGPSEDLIDGQAWQPANISQSTMFMK
jgi:hypothetical protein